jgi:hypothetical protein
MKKAEEGWAKLSNLTISEEGKLLEPSTKAFSGTAYQTYPKSLAVEKQMNYQEGILDGLYQEYYEDGYLKAWGKYEQGQKSGRWEYYDQEANLIKTELYRPPYGLLKTKSWTADLGLLYRLDRHHFGTATHAFFQLEQKFDEQGQLRQEKAMEYGILVAQGDWDEQGNLVASFILQEGGPSYAQWAEYRKLYSAENPYELSF